MLTQVYTLLWGLARTAASITDAAQDIHLAAHNLVGRVAVLAPDQLAAARQVTTVILVLESDHLG